MKLLLSLLFATVVTGVAGDKIKIEWQQGPCCGGNRPSIGCKKCTQCAYCGKQPGKTVKDARPHNSGTCVVCEKIAPSRAK